MNTIDCSFPVKELFCNLNEDMKNYISADIPHAIDEGLINEIKIIDNHSKISTPAEICQHHDPNNRQLYYQVSLSAAFCQFVWNICDMTIRTLDYNICIYESAACGSNINALIKDNEQLLSMPLENVTEILKKWGIKNEPSQFLNQISRSTELLKDPHFHDKIQFETNLALSLLDNDSPLILDNFNKLDIHDGYAQVVNGAFVKAISFVLHHELSHFVLKHFDKTSEEESDEIEADFNAHWTMQNDLPDEEQFTANVGILCLMFAMLFMDPEMKKVEGDVHPREDVRIFNTYDSIDQKNPKYDILLTYLFTIWNSMVNVSGFPEVRVSDPNSVEIIREFMKNYRPEESTK